VLKRSTKSAFFVALRPLLFLSGGLYKLTRAPSSGHHRVHLGPGQRNYIDGWINVDANRFTGRCDVWTDLRFRLPFNDASIAAFYSHHVVEHLPTLQDHFYDVARCLVPGGVYRVGGPNGDGAIQKFLAKDLAWFGDFPDRRTSAGGRLDNFLLCRGEHVAILTESYLTELLTTAGFRRVRRVLPTKETEFPDIFKDVLELEHEDDLTTPHTLIIEAVK
jgi:predicted SAM-dependent methyltransferase